MSRKRSPNWLASEKDLLLSLVSEHFNIIENKRTDAVTLSLSLNDVTFYFIKCSRTNQLRIQN